MQPLFRGCKDHAARAVAQLPGHSGNAARFSLMTETITDLQHRMEEAAQAMDFEEARRLRDQINLMRGGAARAEAEQADTSGLTRQQPGAMGIGTNQQRVTPPHGWKPPRKPDPMVSGTNRRGKGR
ncbi:UvrB/UvrC motif-containing protein [Sphingomonas sp. MMS12-HWE2-04]|uniref:UvrB/UvrC motif-containing protein n=1 Tax=Sphingomonas sp. MMS12-HWE2-04 TaxID=3234199 RepID=UPI00384DE0B0